MVVFLIVVVVVGRRGLLAIEEEKRAAIIVAALCRARESEPGQVDQASLVLTSLSRKARLYKLVLPMKSPRTMKVLNERSASPANAKRRVFLSCVRR